MSNIAKKNNRMINVCKKTPTFILSKIRDTKTGNVRWHVECMNRDILGVRDCCNNIQQGLHFKFCNSLNSANDFIERCSVMVETLHKMKN